MMMSQKINNYKLWQWLVYLEMTIVKIVMKKDIEFGNVQTKLLKKMKLNVYLAVISPTSP